MPHLRTIGLGLLLGSLGCQTSVPSGAHGGEIALSFRSDAGEAISNISSITCEEEEGATTSMGHYASPPVTSWCTTRRNSASPATPFRRRRRSTFGPDLPLPCARTRGL